MRLVNSSSELSSATVSIINGGNNATVTTTKDCKVLILQWTFVVGSTTDGWDYLIAGLYRDNELVKSVKSNDSGQNQYSWTIASILTDVPSGTVFKCCKVPDSTYNAATLKSWKISMYQVY